MGSCASPLRNLAAFVLLAGVFGLLAGPARSAPDSPTPCRGCWRPPPQLTWQIQLQGTIDLTVPVRVYDVDGLDTSAAVVSALHARDRLAICYVDAGTWESWRSDSHRFPTEVLGKAVAGWPGERWLDTRRIDVLAPLIRARLEICRQKGFDAVDPDNVDGYANRTGFPLTYADQLRYNRWIAGTAHELGLAVGLKNDDDQVRDLLSHFDFAVVEQCFEFQSCKKFLPFIREGKAVFEIEYSTPRTAFCASARRLRFSAIAKMLSLSAYRVACDGTHR